MSTETTKLLQSLSAADGDQLVALLAHPSIEEDAALRNYFGPPLHQRMRNLALRFHLMRREEESRGDEKPRSHVVIVPGVLGSELSSFAADGSSECVWVSARTATEGALMRLRLDRDGLRQAEPGYEIRPTGVLKRVYGALMLTLARDFEVHAFAYDWRRSFRAVADDLQAYLSRNFAPGEVVHLVAHAAGGLVVRHLLQKHPDHWSTFGGKLLFLATPHHGSIVGVQALAGHLDLSRWADLLDSRHGRSDFLSVIRSFPSIYEMLPSRAVVPAWSALYEPVTFRAEINDKLLEEAKNLRNLLDQDKSIANARTLCVAGLGRPTFDNIDLNALREFASRPYLARQYSGEIEQYIERTYGEITYNGDGGVPLRLADMREMGVTTLFANVQRQDMLTSQPILQAASDLLKAQNVSNIEWLDELGLSKTPEALSLDNSHDPKSGLGTRRQALRDQLVKSSRSINVRDLTQQSDMPLSDEEREIENTLLFNLSPGLVPYRPSPSAGRSRTSLTIQVEVIHGDISELGAWAENDPPVDAIVIGNQLGEMPQGACRALDQKISAAYGQDSLFMQLIQRNVIRSELANLFLLPDSRPDARGTARTIVIAGQGMPGSFGQPELKILAREVCWVLSRLGKKHLALVALGAGRSSFAAYQVMDAWIRGAKNALTGWVSSEERALTMTFVEKDEEKVLEFDDAIQAIAKELEERVKIEHTPLTPLELIDLQEKADEKIEKKKKKSSFLARIRWEPDAADKGLEAELEQRGVLDRIRRARAQQSGTPSTPDKRTESTAPPIRINVSCADSTYRFGALTENAAIPEREIPLSAYLVSKANDDLAASHTWQEQIEQCRFLASLLLPEDFREHLASDAPVVLSVDATTARIHWELLCPPLGGEDEIHRWSTPGKDSELDQERFLGLGRGLTRQLRTSYAPRPEALPAKKRRLRVLVVSDPAYDAPLPGAQEEGVAVAELFERINQLRNSDHRVEVCALIGPGEASQTNVLRELMNRSYDVLHFSGHCVYDASSPARSGWIFSRGQRVTANEIRRVDRVPAFIFSNACESGVTPNRSGNRSDLLAPTFAEAFFARGVANFICTAWPVDDLAARDFALALYADLLGIEYKKERGPRVAPQSYVQAKFSPQPMHRAMRTAREWILQEYGGNTWGAYQHYGNPDARLFV